MTVSDIITDFGAYYRDGGQSIQDLYRALYAQTDTTQYMTTKIVKGTQWQAAESTIGQVLQPFHKNFTPTSGPTFTAKQIDLYHHKMDVSEYPDDLEDTWLGFLANEKVSRMEWPYAKWLAEVHLFPKFNRDYEKNEIYKGVYAAPNGSTAGAAGTSMNGLGKVIADAITATEMTAITTGALQTVPEDFCTQVEDFCDGIISINEDYADVEMNVHMSKALAQRYARGYRAKYGKDMDFNGTVLRRIDSNFGIVGLSSMSGRSRMFATTKENMVDLKFRETRANLLDIQQAERQVKFLADSWRGAGFIINQIVFPNEQV